MKCMLAASEGRWVLVVSLGGVLSELKSTPAADAAERDPFKVGSNEAFVIMPPDASTVEGPVPLGLVRSDPEQAASNPG